MKGEKYIYTYDRIPAKDCMTVNINGGTVNVSFQRRKRRLPWRHALGG